MPFRDFRNLKKLLFVDDQIKSRTVFRSIVISIFFISLLSLLMEWVIDLPGTDIGVLLVFSPVIGLILLIAVVFKFGDWQKHLLIFSVYAVMEYQTIAFPETFHSIVYWWFLIPTMGIILFGVRSSLMWLIISVITTVCNSIYISSLVGNEYVVTLSIPATLISGLFFLGITFSAVFFLYRLMSDAYRKMKTKSDDLSQLKLKLELSLKSVFELSNHPAVLSGDIDDVYKIICRLVTETLKISRVSIWQYSDAPGKIARIYLFQEGRESDEKVELFEEDYPNYFDAMKSTAIVSAEHAHTHPSTVEFSQSYLTPLDIYSMLDSSFEVDGEFAGVICCEQQNETYHWTPEDILFMRSMSDVISMVHKTVQIKSYSTTVQKQNVELNLQRGKIEEVNSELRSMNDELEERVVERTRVLEKKNLQLAEYAFVNSHLLRAPLSRIKGLSYIISMENIAINDNIVLEALKSSTEELDTIVSKISELLYEGNDFSRQEIQELIKKNYPEQ